MKVVVLGAGGIGCYYAARLMAARNQATLVARGAHLEALQQRGLKVIHPQFSFEQPVEALTLEALKSSQNSDAFDLVILASKSGATVSMLSSLKAWLMQSAVPVLSIQNGVMNEVEIAKVIGKERTIGGLAVRIGGHILEPGVVEVTGEAQIEMGVWPNIRENDFELSRVQQWVETFKQAGIPTIQVEDIQFALWRKLLINNGVNPLTALTLQDTQSVLNDPILQETAYQMMTETARAAQIAGVDIQVADVDEMFELIRGFDAIKTSMQVDREKGRPLEMDDICGPVIRYCRKASTPAKTTELIATLLQYAVKNDV
ncbi:MAG: hypothetical protein CENE_00173 [Candidatus Celerinatantimonas neptuna]|nr:MAG: hypothetical protein CENE_00173 [Candidatus Celerinatantimonas neptuna]